MAKATACAFGVLALLLSACGSGGKGSASRTDTILATSEEPGRVTASSWKGTFTSTSKRLFDGGAHGICSDAWKGELRFAVDDNGRVSGDGRANLTSPPKCPNTAQQFLFRVGGSTDGSLRLRLSWTGTIPKNGSSPTGMASIMMHGRLMEFTGGPSLVIPKTDACHAEADLVTRASIFDGGGPDPNIVNMHIESTCE